MIDSTKSDLQFSIIITVLNGGKTLRRTLESIRDQKFINYELIIIDGGSLDDSVEISREVDITHKKIQVHPGIGLYAGLNAGIDIAIGKWLYFIGADDELYNSNVLQDVSNSISTKNDKTKILVGKVEFVKQKILFHPLLGSPYLLRHLVHHQGMFYERGIFNQMRYNESFRIASDYEFNLILALKKIHHEYINVIVCSFGGDGLSENQLAKGYIEMQHVHANLFTGKTLTWVKNYFWLRRKMGSFLRANKLIKLRSALKRVFG
jgi:putative colanic acid biosynthesis glycosyltransferase